MHTCCSEAADIIQMFQPSDDHYPPLLPHCFHFLTMTFLSTLPVFYLNVSVIFPFNLSIWTVCPWLLAPSSPWGTLSIYQFKLNYLSITVCHHQSSFCWLLFSIRLCTQSFIMLLSYWLFQIPLLFKAALQSCCVLVIPAVELISLRRRVWWCCSLWSDGEAAGLAAAPSCEADGKVIGTSSRQWGQLEDKYVYGKKRYLLDTVRNHSHIPNLLWVESARFEPNQRGQSPHLSKLNLSLIRLLLCRLLSPMIVNDI